MKPWMKIAIGCFAASIIALFLFVGGVVGLGYWAKNKVQEVTGGGPAVEEARKAANSVPFVRPPGNAIPEDRLVQFIEVRASVFSVYEKYRGEIESRMSRVKEGGSVDFADISTGLTLMREIQKAEVLALARHGMSEREYAFITGEVYKSMWAEGGPSDVGRRALKEATQAATTAADAMKRANTQDMPPEAREALARAASEIEANSKDASIQLETMGPAPANIALFKKYEADLKKYAMPGLNILFDEDTQGPAEAATPERP